MKTQQENTQVTLYPLQDDADFWHVRDLLIATYPSTRPGFNWEVRRWDGSRFHDAATDWAARMAGRLHLWRAADGRLVAAVHPDGEGDAQLQVHPDFRWLEPEMLDWAEANLAITVTEAAANGETTQRQLEIFVQDDDGERLARLQARGYVQRPGYGVTRRLRLAEHTPEPTPPLAPGYTLRTSETADPATGLENCQRIADLLNAAFNRDFHTAQEVCNFVRQAPSFRPALDLVAIAPDGAFAAYVGIAYEPTNRHAIFEPVCTHPDHQRRGLARTLMLEGLNRLHALGAADVVVETGDMVPANRLYDGLGFTETFTGHGWRKRF